MVPGPTTSTIDHITRVPVPGSTFQMSTNNQRDERRRRYQLKQESNAADALLPHKSAKHEQLMLHDCNDNENMSAASWISRNTHFCTVVTLDEVKAVKQQRTMVASNRKQTDSTVDGNKVAPNSKSTVRQLDQYLSPYFDIHSRDLPVPSNKGHGKDGRPHYRFIAEGTETIRLLIQQLIVQQTEEVSTTDLSFSMQPIQIESIFLKSNLFFDEPVHLQRDVDQILASKQQQQHSPFQVILGSVETISAVAGFTVSRGCLACGYIPINRNEEWLFEYLNRLTKNFNVTTTVRILALDGISDTSNLGSMIRTASAFGIHAILLSQDCCDAWYRRSIRVSMGHVFRIPIIRVANLSQTIDKLTQPPYSVTSYATIVDMDANIALHKLKHGAVPKRWCCVMGNESSGVTLDVVESCRYTIRIDMEPGVDSLSVPIATGILLHGILERENKIVDDEEVDSK